VSLYSPQVAYCNACGWRMNKPLPDVMGRTWRCCSLECVREMQWRETLSIMGKQYEPDPKRLAAGKVT